MTWQKPLPVRGNVNVGAGRRIAGRPFFCVLVMNNRLAVQRAIQLHSDGQLAAAVDAYRAILEQHPETCACWSNLGMALRSLGRKEEGLTVLRRGARVCPESAELNYNLGNALKETGDHEGALKHYCAAGILDPDDLEAARACGGMLMRLERFDEAVEHYAAALARKIREGSVSGRDTRASVC